MEASLLKGLNHGNISFVGRCTEGSKWPGREGHGGPREDGTIIEVGLALVLRNQDLCNGWGQSARQKIKYMRGDKEFRSRGREKGRDE